MTPKHITETTTNPLHLPTGWRRLQLRKQRASAEWIGLGIDFDHAIDGLDIARRRDVEQLHPRYNEDEALWAVKRAAIAAIASKAAKAQDLPALVRMVAVVADLHDPAWLDAGVNGCSHEPSPAEVALCGLYVQALRLCGT